MSDNLITGARLGGVRDYDWFRERRRQQLAPLAGTQIAVTPDSTAAPICGRLLDSSVMVGGFGGLPIENGAVGIAALGGTAYPAPTWNGSVTVTPSATALSTDVVVQATLNNVPQDGNCASILWVFRRNGQTTWTPWAETPLSGLPNPPASQVQSFGFGDLTSGLAYDFGVAYVTVNGAYGAIAILQSDYAVPVVAIPSSYMLGGTAVTPMFSGVSHTIGTSVNGISTPLTLDWTCTNQPTDGSLSRVSLWIRQNGTTAWTFYASLQAVGVNQSPPPASAAYAFTFTDLTNGLSYDFGLSYENAQGGEGNVAAAATNVAMPTVGAPATAKMSAALLSSGPHISSDTVGAFNNAGTATPSLPIGVTFTDWTNGTLPPWLLGVRFYIRAHGTTNPQPMGDQTPNAGSTTMDVTLGLTAATTVDIGCSYIDNANEESAIAWPGGAWNEVVVPGIGPVGINSLGGPNLIPDSQFAYANFNGSGIAGNDPYWNFYLIDGLSFFIGRGSTATGSNYLGIRPGDSGKVCKAQSEVIVAQPNTEYTVSCYIDATTCSGSNLPYIAIVSTDQSAEYTRASQTIGKNGVVSASYTTPASGGPTQFTVLMNSNNCTVSSSILVFQEPMLQVGQLGPYTPGPSVSGGAAATAPPAGGSGGGAADPGSGGGDGGGYHHYGTLPFQARGVIANAPDTDGTYLDHGQVHAPHIVFGNSGNAVDLDTIPDGRANFGRIRSTHIASGVAYNYKGVWSSATAYVQGDEVVYGPSYWIALAASTNSAPSTGNANWQVVGTYSGYQGAWSSATAYVAGAEVTYNGNYWVCVTGNTNSAPSTSNANWQIAGPSSLDSIADGANRGAVLTSELNGNRVARLNDGTNVRTAGDVANTLRIGGGIDLSSNLHLNRVLDYVSDVSPNLYPNSDTLSGSIFSGLTPASGGPGGATDAEYTGTGSAIGSNAILDRVVPVVMGQTYTPSWWIDPSQISNNNGSTPNVLTEFAGSTQNADGSYSNIAGKVSATKYTLTNGLQFTVAVDIAKANTSTDNSCIGIANGTNEYFVAAQHDGNLVIYKKVSGSQSLVANTGGGVVPSDTAFHNMTLSVVPGSPNTIVATFDNRVLRGTDSSLTLTSGTWAVTFDQDTNAEPIKNYTINPQIALGINTADNLTQILQQYVAVNSTTAGRYATSAWTCPTNLCPNSDSFAAWSKGGWTSGNAGPNGAASLSITAANADATLDNIAVTPGQYHTFSLWVNPSGANGTAQLKICTNGTFTAVAATNIGVGSASQRYSVSYLVPNGVTQIRLDFGTNSDSGTIIISQPMLEPASSASGYYISSQNPQVQVFAQLLSSAIVASGGKFKISQPMLRTDGVVTPYIADKLTYARPLSTRIVSGKPLIDFSENIHLNKHLGNIPDDSGSGRFAVANIDANRKAIIDFNSAHLNQGALSKKNQADLTADVVNVLPRANIHASIIDAIDASGNVLNLGGVADTSITPIANLMPRQAGADVTASNTAADTSKVNGVSSSSISPIATLMPAEAGANITENRYAAGTGSGANQRTAANLAAIVDASGNGLATRFSGQTVLQNAGAYAGWDLCTQASMPNLHAGIPATGGILDSQGLAIALNDWVWAEWTAINNDSGAFGWGPCFVDGNGFIYLVNCYGGAGEFEYNLGNGWAAPANLSANAANAYGKAHTFRLGAQSTSSGIRIVAFCDGVKLVDYNLGVGWAQPLRAGFYYDSANQVYIKDFQLQTGFLPQLAYSTPLNAQGSMGVVGGAPSSLPYTSTSNSITLNLPAVTVTRADQSTISIPAYSYTFSGLSASHTCYVVAGINVSTGAWFTNLSAGGAFSGTQVVTQNVGVSGDGYIPVFVNDTATTAASGQTGGGSGGGGGPTCPAVWQPVETKERGFIRADEVEVGMHLRRIGGWAEVIDALVLPAPIWTYTLEHDNIAESFDVNDTHAVQQPNGEWLIVREMVGGEPVASERGMAAIREAHYLKDDYYVAFTVIGHEYLMGGAICHNATTY